MPKVGFNTNNLIKAGYRHSNNKWASNSRATDRTIRKAVKRDYRLRKQEIKADKAKALAKETTKRSAIAGITSDIGEAIATFGASNIVDKAKTNPANTVQSVANAVEQNVNGGSSSDENSKSTGFNDFGATGRDEE